MDVDTRLSSGTQQLPGERAAAQLLPTAPPRRTEHDLGDGVALRVVDDGCGRVIRYHLVPASTNVVDQLSQSGEVF